MDISNDKIINQIIDLIAQGYIIEIEYNLPATTYGVAVSKSFLVPKGTAININKVWFRYSEGG